MWVMYALDFVKCESECNLKLLVRLKDRQFTSSKHSVMVSGSWLRPSWAVGRKQEANNSLLWLQSNITLFPSLDKRVIITSLLEVCFLLKINKCNL